MNGHGRRAAALSAILLFGGASRAATPGALVVEVTPARQSLAGNENVVVTVTIRNTSRAWQYVPKWQTPFAGVETPLFDVTPPRGQTGTRAQWINHTCAKCHTVLFTHYPWTWEGGERKERMPGGSSISSGEGRDFQLGGCSSQMACTTWRLVRSLRPPTL